MYAKELKSTDDYIRILKELDDHEKLRIINVLTESMLNPPETKSKEAMKKFLNNLSAWNDDGHGQCQALRQDSGNSERKLDRMK